MSKKVKSTTTDFLYVGKNQLDEYEDFYSVYASPTIADLVIANEDEDVPLDTDIVEVAVYRFMGYEKFKKTEYVRVDEE